MRLYKRGNTWWYEFQANGRQIRRSCKTGDIRVARAFVKKIDVARRMPTLEDAIETLKLIFGETSDGRIELRAAYDEYLRVATSVGRANLAVSTIRMRRAIVAKFVAWLCENRPKLRYVEDVTGVVAAEYAEHLAASGAKTKTRANVIGELCAVWKMLSKASDGVGDVWASLRPRDTDGERRDAFTVEQEARVLDAAKQIGRDWYPVCVVARHTGLRYGDVATLTWQEADVDSGVIRKTPRKTAAHGISVALPMIAPVRDALAAVRAEQIANGSFDANGDCFPLHAHFYGHRGCGQRVLAFSQVLAAADVEGNFTFHSWRHTAATRLASSGADIETRKRVLGHAVDETARRYDHDEHLDETRAAMEAAANNVQK